MDDNLIYVEAPCFFSNLLFPAQMENTDKTEKLFYTSPVINREKRTEILKKILELGKKKANYLKSNGKLEEEIIKSFNKKFKKLNEEKREKFVKAYNLNKEDYIFQTKAKEERTPYIIHNGKILSDDDKREISKIFNGSNLKLCLAPYIFTTKYSNDIFINFYIMAVTIRELKTGTLLYNKEFMQEMGVNKQDVKSYEDNKIRVNSEVVKKIKETNIKSVSLEDPDDFAMVKNMLDGGKDAQSAKNV